MMRGTGGLMLLVCASGLGAIGCGGPQLATVSGRVTVNHKPVPAGTIMFHPDNGPTATGAIKADGTYTLTTFKPGDGAVVGSHRVTIHVTAVGGGSLVDPKSIDEELRLSRKGGKVLVAGNVTWIVPEKYADVSTSGLTRVVSAGANSINFDLSTP